MTRTVATSDQHRTQGEPLPPHSGTNTSAFAQINLLGPLELLIHGEEVSLRSERERTILAVLALNLDHTLSVDSLIDTVWGEHPPRTVRNQVSICISSLRKQLAGAICTVPSGYSLSSESVSSDLHEAQRKVRMAREARAAACPERAVRELRSFAALWRGDFLSDVSSEPVRREATLLDAWRTSVREECLELEVELGWYQDAIQELQRIVEGDPFREKASALLVRALYGMGRQNDALSVYHGTRVLLADQLGVDPGPELRRAHETIIHALPVAPARGAPTESAPSGALALQSRSASKSSKNTNVPRQLPPAPHGFGGREEELQRIQDELDLRSRAGVMFGLVITGMGGVGKTALALHWAHSAADLFPDGHLYANLGGSTTVATVLSGFLRALGVPGDQIPTDLTERTARFRSEVSGRRVLIVLDNVHSSDQARFLLPGDLHCATIITSRNSLDGLAVIEGVTYMTLNTLDSDTSILILKKALGPHTESRDSLSELASLCGGLPLALRIASARVASGGVSLTSLIRGLRVENRRLAELSRGEVRLNASFRISYDTLSDQAACLLRRLGLVRATDLPEWVAGALLHTDAVTAQDALQELLGAHLVENGGEDEVGQLRYRINDLVRVYARSRATQENESQVLERYFGGWLHMLRSSYRKGGQLSGSASEYRPDLDDAVLDDPILWQVAERRSLTEVVVQACDDGFDELAWEMAVLRVPVFRRFSLTDEWRATHERVLAAVREAGNERGEAATLWGLGQFLSFVGDSGKAHYRDALQLFTHLGDHHGCGLVLAHSAVERRVQGRLGKALADCKQALVALKSTGDLETEQHVLLNMARIHIQEGDLKAAEQALETVAAYGEDPDLWQVRANLCRRRAEIYLADGNTAGAIRALQQALELVMDHGDLVGQVYLLREQGEVLLRAGNLTRARVCLTTAAALAKDMDNPHYHALLRHSLEQMEQYRLHGSDSLDRDAVDSRGPQPE